MTIGTEADVDVLWYYGRCLCFYRGGGRHSFTAHINAFLSLTHIRTHIYGGIYSDIKHRNTWSLLSPTRTDDTYTQTYKQT